MRSELHRRPPPCEGGVLRGPAGGATLLARTMYRRTIRPVVLGGARLVRTMVLLRLAKQLRERSHVGAVRAERGHAAGKTSSLLAATNQPSDR